MTLTFAQKQLQKFGWKNGQGLGKNEDGITKNITVAMKKDTLGIGSGQDQFGFQWWDHVFNKAANNIQIAKDEDGEITVEQKVELKREDIVTKERPAMGTGSVVNGFVTTRSSAESQEDQTRDFSVKMSDQELFAVCKGRTAHKGARSSMKGKIQRVAGLPEVAKLADDSSDSEAEVIRKRKLMSVLDVMRQAPTAAPAEEKEPECKKKKKKAPKEARI